MNCDCGLGGHNSQPNDKLRKIKDEYESKISNLNKQLKTLQMAKREHAQMLRSQTQYESQIKMLRMDVTEMKKTKVSNSVFDVCVRKLVG